MYIHWYKYVHIIDTYIYLRIHMCIYISIHTYLEIHSCMCTRICIRIHVYIKSFTIYIYIYICTKYTYAYMYMFLHTHAYTYIHIHVQHSHIVVASIRKKLWLASICSSFVYIKQRVGRIGPSPSRRIDSSLD